MDPILLVITAASLAFAVAMSFVAWRVLRADRQRAMARMDALRAMAFTTEAPVIHPIHETSLSTPEHDDLVDARPPVPVALSEPSQHEAATVDEPWDLVRQPFHETAHDSGDASLTSSADAMFEQPHAAGVAGRRWLGLAAAALLIAAGVATVSALNSPELTAAVAATRSEQAKLAPSTLRPVELLSLRHVKAEGDSLTVTGLVQNPTDGQLERDMIAVVHIFDSADRYLASNQAPLARQVLAPGDESPFVVTMIGAADVARYRVGFRRGDGGTVTHVDRRGQFPAGTTDATTDAGTIPAVLAPEAAATAQ